MQDEVDILIEMLHGGRPVALGAIEWASPVVSFGDPTTAEVATLGLNPSNLEFVDRRGVQLEAPNHRFESLATLQRRDWGRLDSNAKQRVWRACADYFSNNPYDGWFKRLERIIVNTGASFYNRIGTQACHLDLVPFATSRKWSDLTKDERSELIELGTPSLARTIMASNIRVLVLNGSSVVREFSRLMQGASLEARTMPTWSLQDGRVAGHAYVGRITQIGDIGLDRELLVLGYNHNIQSSFGVTTEVVTRIASWIGRTAEGDLK